MFDSGVIRGSKGPAAGGVAADGCLVFMVANQHQIGVLVQCHLATYDSQSLSSLVFFACAIAVLICLFVWYNYLTRLTFGHPLL